MVLDLTNDKIKKIHHNFEKISLLKFGPRQFFHNYVSKFQLMQGDSTRMLIFLSGLNILPTKTVGNFFFKYRRVSLVLPDPYIRSEFRNSS